ncbi:hypothetical protein METBIDRAFT_65453 [Metschnikowia bicuspidata var. bicuspidata NRRL YB-4993]|uniref:Uncharacterized protein n=1 Tax=Metschnikowia bicuspidata var. bicuspidata NRRL YB-4993 TaxID=869754 RepID=A0A1A0HJF7_9ASCO|nr:hypothetical protein METBIDRAFT_65453 [Metschnikowia bicuspidata var. bicuspidata NRRL YB-4993]OBA23973.1 hypothetical protein METBIDRAFT_65453 [Metschnikowia bicuspidata var. bicuspidata NRRL YB-4993]
MPLPQGSPFSHKIIVSTIATAVGIYGFWLTAKDFEFVKFVPRSPEEIEIRRKENIGLQIKHLETRTLDYTPEAKARIAQSLKEYQTMTETKEPAESSD